MGEVCGGVARVFLTGGLRVFSLDLEAVSFAVVHPLDIYTAALVIINTPVV